MSIKYLSAAKASKQSALDINHGATSVRRPPFWSRNLSARLEGGQKYEIRINIFYTSIYKTYGYRNRNTSTAQDGRQKHLQLLPTQPRHNLYTKHQGVLLYYLFRVCALLTRYKRLKVCSEKCPQI